MRGQGADRDGGGPADGTACGRSIGLVDYPGGMPGFYADGVSGLVLEGMEITRPDGVAAGWGATMMVVERI